MTQSQLYWIIAAVVVLIAIALLIALSSRRRRGAELDQTRADDLRRAGTADPVRDAAAQPRTPLASLNADVAPAAGAGIGGLAAADQEQQARPTSALSSFDVTKVDGADASAQDASTQDASTGLSSLSMPAAVDSSATREASSEDAASAGSAPVRSGSTAAPAPVSAEPATSATPVVDPLEAAIAAAPDKTAAEIAAEAAAEAEAKKPAETAPTTPSVTPATTGHASDAEESALGLAAAGVAGGSGVVLDESDRGVELPEPVAPAPIATAPVTSTVTSAPAAKPTGTGKPAQVPAETVAMPTVGLGAAGVAGGSGVVVDEDDRGARLPEPTTPSPVTPAAPVVPNDEKQGSASGIAAAGAAAASVGLAETGVAAGSGVVVDEKDGALASAPAVTPAQPVAERPAAPSAPEQPAVPTPADGPVVDGTPGVPGRIAFPAAEEKTELVSVSPDAERGREAGVLGRAADTLKEKAAPLVEKASPLVQKAAPLTDKAAPLVEKAVKAATPVVEKAVSTAAPLARKAASTIKDKLAEAQKRRWGRS